MDFHFPARIFHFYIQIRKVRQKSVPQRGGHFHQLGRVAENFGLFDFGEKYFITENFTVITRRKIVSDKF